MRYGIGVGRDGFAWSGTATVARKAKWPRWTPPTEMLARDRRARRWAAGMPGGSENPLGARALYLYQNGRDTLYRIHGTFEPWSIGRAVSSGCIRLLNGRRHRSLQSCSHGHPGRRPAVARHRRRESIDCIRGLARPGYVTVRAAEPHAHQDRYGDVPRQRPRGTAVDDGPSGRPSRPGGGDISALVRGLSPARERLARMALRNNDPLGPVRRNEAHLVERLPERLGPRGRTRFVRGTRFGFPCQGHSPGLRASCPCRARPATGMGVAT
jgi:hypothetical protein